MTQLLYFAVFKELQKESEFQRKEWFRKQGEPETPYTHASIKITLFHQS